MKKKLYWNPCLPMVQDDDKRYFPRFHQHSPLFYTMWSATLIHEPSLCSVMVRNFL